MADTTMAPEVIPTPDWCRRLHQFADAAALVVVAAGWRVKSVCVIVTPEAEGVPELVLVSAERRQVEDDAEVPAVAVAAPAAAD